MDDLIPILVIAGVGWYFLSKYTSGSSSNTSLPDGTPRVQIVPTGEPNSLPTLHPTSDVLLDGEYYKFDVSDQKWGLISKGAGGVTLSNWRTTYPPPYYKYNKSADQMTLAS